MPLVAHHFGHAQIRARSQARLAVKKGILSKPDRCARCGKLATPDSILHKHHPNYRYPLDVVWLCSRCHGMADHRQSKKTKNCSPVPDWGPEPKPSIRRCPKCPPGVVKPASDFNKDQGYCRSCQSITHAEWRSKKR